MPKLQASKWYKLSFHFLLDNDIEIEELELFKRIGEILGGGLYADTTLTYTGKDGGSNDNK
jgi:hypothetical protein